MSSADSEAKSKIRRNPGACDVCRKRKVRCNSNEMPGNRCTNCVASGLNCTHNDVMKTLASAKGYVEILEARLEKAEKLLKKAFPGIDLTEHLYNDGDSSLLEDTELPRNDDEALVKSITKLTINPEERRFFGKSSGMQFVQTALNFKTHFIGPRDLVDRAAPERRKEYWTQEPWLLPPENSEEIPYMFPEPDLLAVLVELYFTNVNCYHPTLHRPTFERKLKDQLHVRDHQFGGVLLMVCSLGARHSNDPRVLLSPDHSFHAAGLKWHNQVRVIGNDLILKPTLEELQVIILSSLFLLAISPVAWCQIGFGVRRAQDVGAHRCMKQPHPTVETEQWKRVWWVLLCLDWTAGTIHGRPFATNERDYDQELPVDCDDEFWDLPEPLNFRQPDQKPSSLAFFVYYAQLLEIQASVIGSIYSPSKPKNLTGQPSLSSDAQAVIAFDSALNSWFLKIPDHLKWDADRRDLLHFNQSAVLYAAYYNVRILVHRPYIPAPQQTSRPGALPSLAICTNAARSCAQIFDAQDRRGEAPNQNMVPAAFTCAIVLLLNTYRGKMSGFAYNPGKGMDDVHKCIKFLTAAEKWYPPAGRFNDILARLMPQTPVGNIHNGFASRPHESRTTAPSYDSSVFASAPQPESHPAAPRWSKELVQQYIGDIQASNEQRDEALRPKPKPVQISVSNVDALYSDAPDMQDLENLMRVDPAQFPSYGTPMDTTDVMTMWASAPSGFQMSDWESYFSATGESTSTIQYPGVAYYGQ